MLSRKRASKGDSIYRIPFSLEEKRYFKYDPQRET